MVEAEKMMWSIILCLAVCSAVAQCYTCPEDNTSVCFVDVAENCTVYSCCNGSELKNFTCPKGTAFDVTTEVCRNASEVLCLENSLIRQKRQDLQIHSISIDNMKNGLKKMKKELMSSVETLIEEIAPTILTEIQKKYITFVSNVKEEIMPIVRQKLLPHIKTSITYVKQLGLRIADKIHQSIEMSNSTHINIVSFSDIMSDVSKDAQPLLKLGKFFSSKALRGARVKRQTYFRQSPTSLPEAFVTYFDPFVAGFIPAARNMMITNEYTVKNRVILPIIFDMLQDPETRYDLIRIFFIAKDSFGPIAIDMFFQQPFFAPRGSVVHLSTDQVLAAKLRFTFEAKPLIVKVALKYMPVIVRRCVDNAPLIMESIARLKQSALPYVPELMFRVKNFMEKHGSLLLTSSSTHINTYSLMEIKEDLKPIGRILLEIFIDKMSKEPNSFLSSFFNRNSVLYTVLTADESRINTGKRAIDPRIPALRKAFSTLPQAQKVSRVKRATDPRIPALRKAFSKLPQAQRMSMDKPATDPRIPALRRAFSKLPQAQKMSTDKPATDPRIAALRRIFSKLPQAQRISTEKPVNDPRIPALRRAFSKLPQAQHMSRVKRATDPRIPELKRAFSKLSQAQNISTGKRVTDPRIPALLRAFSKLLQAQRVSAGKPATDPRIPALRRIFSKLPQAQRMSTEKPVTDPRIPALRRAFSKLPQAQYMSRVKRATDPRIPELKRAFSKLPQAQNISTGKRVTDPRIPALLRAFSKLLQAQRVSTGKPATDPRIPALRRIFSKLPQAQRMSTEKPVTDPRIPALRRAFSKLPRSKK